jgi:hypothetical protein
MIGNDLVAIHLNDGGSFERDDAPGRFATIGSRYSKRPCPMMNYQVRLDLSGIDYLEMEIWNNIPKSLNVSRKSLTIDSGVGVRITKDAILCKTSDKGVCIFVVPGLMISARNFKSEGVTRIIKGGF